jgi:hypothetical protein
MYAIEVRARMIAGLPTHNPGPPAAHEPAVRHVSDDYVTGRARRRDPIGRLITEPAPYYRFLKEVRDVPR